jgi:hypothetical protein
LIWYRCGGITTLLLCWRKSRGHMPGKNISRTLWDYILVKSVSKYSWFVRIPLERGYPSHACVVVDWREIRVPGFVTSWVWCQEWYNLINVYHSSYCWAMIILSSSFFPINSHVPAVMYLPLMSSFPWCRPCLFAW